MADQPIIFYKGKLFTVELAQQASGRSKIHAFLTKKLDKRRLSKIIVLIQKYADTGKIINNQQFKKLRGQTRLSEFKDFQVRVLMYHYGPGLIVLTHGFIKRTDNTPQNEIDRGERIAKDYDKIRKGFENA